MKRSVILLALLIGLLLMVKGVTASCVTIYNPTTISNSGCYILGGDISADENNDAVRIATENVVLDLNGYTLRDFHSGSVTHYALNIYSSSNTFRNITIQNGNISGKIRYDENNKDNTLDYMVVNFTNVALEDGEGEFHGHIHNYYFNFKDGVIKNYSFTGNPDTSNYAPDSTTHSYSNTLKFSFVNMKVSDFTSQKKTTSRYINTYYYQYFTYSPVHSYLENCNFNDASWYSAHNNYVLVATHGLEETGGLDNGTYGNYWANTDGTGYSQSSNCQDADNDGICDNAYQLPNGAIDHYPLANPNLTNPPTSNGGENNEGGNENETTIITNETYKQVPINLSAWTSQCDFDGRNYVFCDNFEYNKPVDWLDWWYPTEAWNGSEWVDLGLEYPQSSPLKNGYPLFIGHALHIRRGIPYNPDVSNNTALGFFSAPPIAHSINLKFINPLTYHISDNSDCFLYYSGRGVADNICHAPISSQVGSVWVSFNYYFDDDDVEYVAGDTNYSEPDSLDIAFTGGPFTCYPSSDAWNGGWYCQYPYALFSGVFINHTLYFDDPKYEIFNWSLNAWMSGTGAKEIDNIPNGATILFHFRPSGYFIWQGEGAYFGEVQIYVNGEWKYTAQTSFYPDQNVPSSAIIPLTRIDALLLHQRFGNSSYIDNVKVWYDTSNFFEGILKSKVTNASLSGATITFHSSALNITKSVNTNQYGYFHSFLPSSIYDVNVTLNNGYVVDMATSKVVVLDKNNKEVSTASLTPFVLNHNGRYIFYVSDAKLGATNTDEFITAFINKYHLGTLTKGIIAIAILIVVVVLLANFGSFAQVIGGVGVLVLFSVLGFVPSWAVFLLAVGSIAWLVYVLFLHGGSAGGGGSA